MIPRWPHSGNTSPSTGEVDDPDEPTAFIYLGEVRYSARRCMTCRHASFWSKSFHEGFSTGSRSEQGAPWSPLWPIPPLLHDSVPDRVRKLYREATSIKKQSSNGFANLVRRCLEAICNDQGIPSTRPKKDGSGTVSISAADRVKELKSLRGFPDALARMADLIRLFGNQGAHESGNEPDVEASDVEVIDDFFRAVIEYVYVAPDKVQEIEDRLRIRDAWERGEFPTTVIASTHYKTRRVKSDMLSNTAICVLSIRKPRPACQADRGFCEFSGAFFSLRRRVPVRSRE